MFSSVQEVQELAGRITTAGNLAGVGAKMTAVNQGQFAFTGELVKRIEFIELADRPGFQKNLRKVHDAVMRPVDDPF